MESAAAVVDDQLSKLDAIRSNLAAILSSSSQQNENLDAVDGRLSTGLETLAVASDAIAPLQTQSIASKALHSRINRAVSPALSVLHSFDLVESLQRRLIVLSDDTSAKPHLACLLKYVDCVDRLNVAINAVTTGCEPAVLRLQEAVEFLSRTKATDQLRIHRLRETLGAIKALYEGEVDAMRYEGLLDEALLRLQDEYEGILQKIRHKGIGEGDGGKGDILDEDREIEGEPDTKQLASDLEVEVLGRISETLAMNDCLDLCIYIYVKVRYRRAAKALMKLNPRYLKTYAPEEIDKMEWEVLESAITLWIEHFQLAVNTVFVAEKKLCKQVLSSIMDGAIWLECFAKIADKIMAVFFRFGEGVARSSKEPQKLFKLLDMYDSMDRICSEFSQVFDGESGSDICGRFRELQKLLVHAASKVFWEFGLQIEGLQDGAPAPPDGAVPKIVRYAVNYLKCLAGSSYAGAMGQVLRTEQIWKAGFLSMPDPDESLLRVAISNALDALQRNVESKRSRYKDKVVPHVLAMNTYWYMYMRTRGSELAKLVGEEMMKKKYKTAAEEAAYSYQAQGWGPMVKLLEREESTGEGREGGGAVARGKMEVFVREFDENLRRHQSCYCIPDEDLREQIKEAVAKLVLPAYAGFLHSYSHIMQGRSFLPPDSIKELLGRLFGGEVERSRKLAVDDGRIDFKRKEFKSRVEKKIDKDEREEKGKGSRVREDKKEEDKIFKMKMERKGSGRSLGKKEELEKESGGSFERRVADKDATRRFERREKKDEGEKERLNRRKEIDEEMRSFRRKIKKKTENNNFQRIEGRDEGEEEETFKENENRKEGAKTSDIKNEMRGEEIFGRRDENKAEEENFERKKRESFRRRDRSDENNEGSFGRTKEEHFRNMDKKEKVLDSSRWNELRNPEEERIAENEEKRMPMEFGTTYIRRREFRNHKMKKDMKNDIKRKREGWKRETTKEERKKLEEESLEVMQRESVRP